LIAHPDAAAPSDFLEGAACQPLRIFDLLARVLLGLDQLKFQ
jgi:hypothetical protein